MSKLDTHDGTVPRQLQEALALFDADVPLTKTQRALVRAAFGTPRGREATWRWVRARARLAGDLNETQIDGPDDDLDLRMHPELVHAVREVPAHRVGGDA
jgi:hypothetical protein